MVYSTLVDVFKQPSRNLTGQVVCSTKNNTNIIYHDAADDLASVKVERTAPSGKFFGYTVGQRIHIELLTKSIDVSSNKIKFTVKDKNDGNNVYFPNFYLDTVEYNETTDKADLIGYDLIAGSDQYTISEVGITFPITLYDYANAVVTYLGGTLEADFTGVNPVLYTANFDGHETLHEVLTAIAEATGSICFCSTDDKIVFKHLTNKIDDVLTPDNYFKFTTKDAVTLTRLTSVTELNENYTVGYDGYTQVLRENPFLVLRDDILSLLEAIGDKVIGLTICPYTLKFRGNPCYEPGDCLSVTSVDGVAKRIFFISENFRFNGGFVSESDWEIAAEENPEANSTNLGTVLKQTYAKVDKANQRIELVAKETSDLQEQASELLITTEGVLTEVRTIEEQTQTAVNNLNNDVIELSKKVQTAVTSENVSIAIQQELANGVNTVTTTTGFTFDAEGLTIDKSGTEMSTQITEDGMTVYREDTPVLVANNIGVEATNLYATTFLIIGENVRFESYVNDNSESRVGCFWIGS